MSGSLTLRRQRDHALIDALRAVLGFGPLYGAEDAPGMQSRPDMWWAIDAALQESPRGSGGFFTQQRANDPGVVVRQRAAMRHRTRFRGL